MMLAAKNAQLGFLQRGLLNHGPVILACVSAFQPKGQSGLCKEFQPILYELVRQKVPPLIFACVELTLVAWIDGLLSFADPGIRFR